MAKFTGEWVDQFTGKGLSVQIILNDKDEEAKSINKDKPAPIMLRNLERENDTRTIPNAVIVEEGSIIAFNLKASGTAGYGFSINLDSKSITTELFATTKTPPAKDLVTSIRKYQHTGEMIQVKKWSDLPIERDDTEALLSYQKCEIVCWDLLWYMDVNGNFYGDTTLVRGGSNRVLVDMSMGGAVPWGNSSESYNEIEKRQDFKDILTGHCQFYFYVFKDLKAQESFFEIYKSYAPTAEEWD